MNTDRDTSAGAGMRAAASPKCAQQERYSSFSETNPRRRDRLRCIAWSPELRWHDKKSIFMSKLQSNRRFPFDMHADRGG
jgi:hypothetical protein